MNSSQTIQQALTALLEKSKDQKKIEFKMIMHELAGRGYPAMLVLIGLPFCFPIQIPGFSTPFGLLLMFMGLRIAFGKKMHWPKWLLRQQISYSALEKIVHKVIVFLNWCRFLTRPRLVFLIQNPWLHRCHGLLVALLGFILALPLPIPLSNVLIAFPIVILGLSMLEDDGLLLILAYFSASLAFTFFAGLFWLGKATLAQIF